jgi:DNA-damage-inducible protein J
MAKTSTMTLRVDPEIKKKASAVYARYGMSVPQAVNIFLYESVYEQGLPFDLRPKPQTTDRAFPLTQTDLDNATRLRTNPKTGHILVTKDDPQDLQDWAVNG